MSDRMYARIVIGGPIKDEETARELLEVLVDEGLSPGEDPCDEFLESADEWEAYILNEIDKKKYLEAHDVEADMGMFRYLEEFLIKHDIEFNRYSWAKYDYAAQIAIFRKGWDGCKLVSAISTMSVDPCIDTTSLRKHLKDGKSLQDVIEDLEEFESYPPALEWPYDS